MAYNPGVVDRSGEILAQSRMAAGSSLLQGLTGGIETYRKNRLQNQLLTGENDALLAGLQQLQGMQGGAAIANLAPAGMNKLVEKHTQGGGLGLNESMQLNAMLNTTLKTAQAGQKMQAEALNQRVLNQQLENEVFKGQQAQKDVAGLGKALKEISTIENPSQTQIFDILSKQDLSPAAMNQFGEIFKGTLPRAGKPATGTEALYQSQRQAFIDENGRPPTAAEDAKIRQGAIEAGRSSTTINTGDEKLTGRVFDTLEKNYNTAVAAQRSLPAYAEARKLLQQGNVITGAGAEAQLAVEKGLAFFGIERENAANTEVLRAQLAQPVFALVQQLGSGSGISNADLQFSERAAGGKITLDKKAIARLVEIGEKAAKASITSYRTRLDRTYPKGRSEFEQSRASLELPDLEEIATAPSAAPQGAYNFGPADAIVGGLKR
jgi:hypothetical protein